MARWAAAGVIGQIRDQLRKRIRREMGKAPEAVATVIDSQSIKAAETVGKTSRPPPLPSSATGSAGSASPGAW